MLALIRTAAVCLFALVAPAAALAAEDAQVDVTQLMAASPLGDMALGDPSAPVTVVEYASLTCSHCGRFYQTTFDAFKAKYIDTGKVYFVLREFPLDQLALVAVMGARCAEEKEFFPIVDQLFREQKDWAFVEKPGDALLARLAQHGVDEADFKACLGKDGLVKNILAVQEKGEKTFGVSGTPTFFFNGMRHVGEMTMAQIDAMIEPLLKPTE